MRHVSLTPFGRGPATLAHLASPIPARPAVDKWHLLGRLRVARVEFGLGDRDLAVLHALLSFLPARELRAGDPLVVFPSNASLGDRAHGMAESTLRRHIARLVASGILARRDSANGKRFAQRCRSGGVQQAFGFDLLPLLASADRIEAAAQEAEEQARVLATIRCRVVVMVRDATKLAALARTLVPDAAPDPEPILFEARQGLRRKGCLTWLHEVEALLRDLLDRLRDRLIAPDASASDSQTERHQQDSDSETPEPVGSEEAVDDAVRPNDLTKPGMPLAVVLKACPAMSAYSEGPLRGWNDLERTADRVAPWLGIDQTTWGRARARMGGPTAAATLAAMVERAAAIRNPGGYLRSLTDRFDAGAFALGPMIMALLRPTERPS